MGSTDRTNDPDSPRGKIELPELVDTRTRCHVTSLAPCPERGEGSETPYTAKPSPNLEKLFTRHMEAEGFFSDARSDATSSRMRIFFYLFDYNDKPLSFLCGGDNNKEREDMLKRGFPQQSATYHFIPGRCCYPDPETPSHRHAATRIYRGGSHSHRGFPSSFSAVSILAWQGVSSLPFSAVGSVAVVKAVSCIRRSEKEQVS